jgi:hypothetical protein
MTDTSHKPVLIELLEEARARERAFWEGLSEAERSARGEADHWAARDVVAHVTYWKDRLAGQLEAVAQGQEPEQVDDFEAVNRQVFEANRDRTWDDLLEYEAGVFPRLTAALAALPDELLDDPERFESTRGRPLWWRVAFNGFYHPLVHLCDLHLERGQGEEVQALHERIAQCMAVLDDSDAWQGVTLYNLACFYALNQRPEPALENLRRAFQLSPDLVAYSKEDSDLDSLRELPDFQAFHQE